MAVISNIIESIGRGMSVNGVASVAIRARRASGALLLGLAAVLVAAPPAMADATRLAMRYDIRWLNLAPIGKAFLALDIDPAGSYTANVSARILTARVAVTSSGAISGERVLPSAFATTVSTNERRHTIQMSMAAGTVRQARVLPEPKPKPDIVALTPAHQRGILDPLSAALMPVPQGGKELGPATCDRTLPVFEGTERFDIELSYLRKATIEGGGGDAYKGPAVVCKARYRAIAGHRESADYVAYFAKDPLVEVWLVPVAGTSMVVPIKTTVPTPFGTIVVEASRFRTGDADTAAAKPGAR